MNKARRSIVISDCRIGVCVCQQVVDNVEMVVPAGYVKHCYIATIRLIDVKAAVEDEQPEDRKMAASTCEMHGVFAVLVMKDVDTWTCEHHGDNIGKAAMAGVMERESMPNIWVVDVWVIENILDPAQIAFFACVEHSRHGCG